MNIYKKLFADFLTTVALFLFVSSSSPYWQGRGVVVYHLRDPKNLVSFSTCYRVLSFIVGEISSSDTVNDSGLTFFSYRPVQIVTVGSNLIENATDTSALKNPVAKIESVSSSIGWKCLTQFPAWIWNICILSHKPGWIRRQRQFVKNGWIQYCGLTNGGDQKRYKNSTHQARRIGTRLKHSITILECLIKILKWSCLMDCFHLWIRQ
jgi:hypothetical protein